VPEGWYLTEALTLIIWPITPDGLITGERVYFAQQERVVRRVAPDELRHLGPLDRSTG
jgi:hypothetical protein